jgi:hypothetical protein
MEHTKLNETTPALARPGRNGVITMFGLGLFFVPFPPWYDTVLYFLGDPRSNN